MHTLNTARDIYTDTAADSEGQSSEQFARNLEQQRDHINEMANLTRAQVGAAMDAPRSAQPEHLQETAEHLDQAVSDVKAATKGGSITVESLEGDAAGQANLAQQGSQVFDPTKSQGEHTVVDKDFLTGVVRHEEEHTGQAVQDVAAVKITAKGAEIVDADPDTTDPSVITAKQFVEVGAMNVQIQAAPKSFEGLHDSYKGWYRKILAHGSPDQVQKLARQKDGLRRFAAEVAR